MSENCNHIDDVIFQRNGTDQKNRFTKILDPDSIELHDFDVEDWILFAYNFAQNINYFKVDNDQIPSGNWQDFFNHFGIASSTIPKRIDPSYKSLKESISTTLSDLESESAVTPHMTLFICFLRLLELSKDRLNGLTKKHLDFYYQEVLQISKLEPVADQVHVIFEIAKKSVDEKIEVNTSLDGGKDGFGQKRIYKTKQELIANKAQVSQLKSLYIDHDLQEIKKCPVSNSFDGKGKALVKESPYWWPFGYSSEEESYDPLDSADLGFAIASPMLALQEGDRNVSISISFKSNFNFSSSELNDDDLIKLIQVYCSGEKEWLGPFNLSKDLAFFNGTDDDTISSSISGNQLNCVFSLPSDQEAISQYNQDILGENINSNYPVVRFLIKTEEEPYKQKIHFLFRQLVKKAISNINVKVDVRGVKSLIIDSDTGQLNPQKPFYPFTTQPVKGSSFKISSPEMFSKKWKHATINIKWINTPDDFGLHYGAYKTEYISSISKQLFIDHMFLAATSKVFKSANQPESPKKDIRTEAINDDLETNFQIDTSNRIVPNNDHFKGTLSIHPETNTAGTKNNVILFQKTNGDFEMNTVAEGTGYELGKSGPIEISLNQSFYHSLFPRLYTLAMMDTNKETPIPNEPYTPFAESITLGYTAEESTDFNVLDHMAFEKNRIKLFHEAAFGQAEEHGYLKVQAKEKAILNTNATNDCWLVPDYCQGGELYIGLSDALPTQQVALLIQVLEGSENPEADSFVGRQKVEWSILCNNQWKNIENSILLNNIDNFLKSGIFKFSIPAQANQDNTVLPKGHIWIRAKIHKTFDAVCKLIDIKAQAVLAEFENNGNELSHLEKGLPAGSISKLITRVPQIKGINQPFNSFGGQPEESDDVYYRRVSERLRHKNRAITLWDYEHLVLQKYPEIYKVKCLNHTSDTSFLAPGHVLLVVVPDIINKNVFDIYEPRVSKAVLNNIQAYLNQLNSKLVNAKVINPQYEKVVVKLGVKFYQQYDENFYKGQLNEDLTKFLSPWAFDNTQDITFGTELHNSILIDYVEKLYYVDYLEELELAKLPNEIEIPEDPTSISYLNQLDFGPILKPESPKHILVSAKKHSIFTNIKNCSETSIEESETCQY
ncbi:baseplate J/gp47 family protein [Echinicola sp. CAU 1574]|uniref:Baseplate J/gp47 family protein n=1 Tax=Echinicola arenosa TaxID=2774144 RepID=A0ABR9AKE0_9BACT|nr:baseplate J/gp47 family protein [Echinicola arenosa]MBD8489283.1 baseplate J/gp47 family protein [Echinicola arenosa]